MMADAAGCPRQARQQTSEERSCGSNRRANTNFLWGSVDPQDAATYGDEYRNTVSAGFSTARIGLNWKLN